MIQKSTVLLYVPEMMEMPAGRTTGVYQNRTDLVVHLHSDDPNHGNERADELVQWGVMAWTAG